MKVSELKNLIENVISKEVRNKIISESKEVYHIKCEGVPLGTFDTEEEAKEALPSYKAKHDGELIIEKGQYDSHESMIDKLDEMNDELEETDNMEPREGNAFGDAHQKAVLNGDDEFEVGGKEYDVNEKEEQCDECGDTEMKEGTCEKCGKELCECSSGMYESKKKRTIRLTESELTKLIAKMVNESIPGLDAVKSAHDGDKETKQHLSDVEQKMNKSASFDGNDNPEFPKPIGKGEKVARQNTEKENEYVEDTRGGTLLNLEYNTEPSDQFKDRLKKALEGDASTGNSQEYANVIKSDTGKNLAKQAERKKKKEDAEFSVSWGHSWKSPEEVKVVNETTFKMSDVLEEEIKKMKDMVNYNKKTQ